MDIKTDDLKYDTLYQRFISGLVKLCRVFADKFIRYDVFSYIFIGVLTTVVNYVIYFPMLWILTAIPAESMGFVNFICKTFGGDYEAILAIIANVVAWIGAVTFAFFPNKTAVFENHDMSKKTVFREFIGFYLSRLFSLIAECVIIYIFIDLLHLNTVVIKIIASIVVLVLNFVLSKFFVFNDKKERKNEN